jgi:hypothetical protein
MRFVIGALIVVAIVILLNAGKSRETYTPQAPAPYSVGTVCFDDGAGGISNPDECLP